MQKKIFMWNLLSFFGIIWLLPLSVADISIAVIGRYKTRIIMLSPVTDNELYLGKINVEDITGMIVLKVNFAISQIQVIWKDENRNMELQYGFPEKSGIYFSS